MQLQNGVTAGIEFECDRIARDSPLNKTRKLFKTTHDASCETPVTTFNRFRTCNKVPANLQHLGRNKNIVGTELVSTIVNPGDGSFSNYIIDVCNELIESGEPYKSKRSGIHYHITSTSPNVGTLKQFLRLGGYFELLAFHLGGMGYAFRGLSNDSIYCRPITGLGAPCIKFQGVPAHSFSFSDLVSTDKFDLEDFWLMYGDLANHTSRYNPPRYTWLNLVNMCQYTQDYKGTLEFRVFNKTLNPYFIIATMEWCQAFTLLGMATSYVDIKEMNIKGTNSILDPHPEKTPEFLLDHFADITSLAKETKEVLKEILKLTPKFSLPDRAVWSHLVTKGQGLGNYWERNNYKPKLAKSAVHANYIDSHVLGA